MSEQNKEKAFEKGGISVQTEHIFPIIKRWLYSDKEIFLREIVSNACDAVTKHKRLVSLNEAPGDEAEYRITVTLDKDLSTITVSDNGIGMTADEIKRYINQIALSGALDFIEKYESKSDSDGSSGIIGHFGLGFYSAFMVSEYVEINTKSFQDGPASYWKCSDTGEFEMGEGEKTVRGTEVVMHISDDEKEFLDKARLNGILNKYCAFMSVPIYFIDKSSEEKKANADKEKKDGEENESEKPINDTSPLWLRPASECTDEMYRDFYKKVFDDWREPLFYIHINADFPLNFKGILYFPKLAHEYENLEGQVKLYYNQVFVADNIKEVIPEYMMLLKGVLDCPELPLNVSRSYLQNSGYVSKVSAHITKKISDKLNSLFNTQRADYEKFWDDIKPFVEYGCMRDGKFYDKTKDAVIFKTADDEYVTLAEYSAHLSEKAGITEKIVYYATNKLQQINYIRMYKEQNIDVLLLDALIDTQFISFLEGKLSPLKFVRIDSDVDSALRNTSEADQKDETNKPANEEALKKLFTSAAGEGVEIVFESLKSGAYPALVTLSESERRFADMMKLYSRGENIPGNASKQGEKLVINKTNALIKRLSDMISDQSKSEKAAKIAKQIYMLAVIAQRPLDADELQNFVGDSIEYLSDSAD
ncbi:MAG: molecular chaperone HtpG [Oscillospiraceae bacterium]|nr:molecular chaperone HtpG [Oscillospiraceae bacterium]